MAGPSSIGFWSLMVLVLMAMTAKVTAQVCPVAGYVNFNGVCYKHFAEPKTYGEARQTCAADGGLLAMPKDSATNSFIHELGVNERLWIGLNDLDDEGQFVFEDGQTLESSGFSNWLGGEPNDNHGREDCTEVLFSGHFWNDKQCNENREFVCQQGSTWTHIPGRLKSVSVGLSGVWGVNSAGRIYYRVGTAFNENSAGTRWQRVPGSLAKISVGNGIVWGVNSNDFIYYRAGINRSNPMGIKWVRVSGKLTTLDVSSSSNQVWGVTRQGAIYKRTGIISASKRMVEARETLQDLSDVLLDSEDATEVEQETRDLEDMEKDAGLEEDTENEVRELEEIEENAGMAAEDDE